MKTSGIGPDKLRHALRRAYIGKEPPEIGLKWRDALMAKVREIGPLCGKPRFLPSFEKIVWRLVPITTPLALILIFFLVKLGLASAQNSLQSFINGLEEWTIIQFFSV
ncbi:MAG TPA: hypothetical protein VGJ94_10520 [Syntrophorhabdaceae bacterium]|jgi:hypothetical protein